jgi:ribosomal protein S18 acetylase RimI-like enzyme
MTLPRTDPELKQNSNWTLRYEVRESDREAVRQIVTATDFFRIDEIDVAVELVDARLSSGAASGYEFVMAECGSTLVGYSCYGHIACTLGSYDLYWIAVAPQFQGRGLGQFLMVESERLIRKRGGRHVYIETSSLPQYLPTRAFYERCGYEVVAVFADFYDHNDDKVVWRKVLTDNEC